MSVLVRFRWLAALFLAVAVSTAFAAPNFSNIPLVNVGPDPDTKAGKSIIDIHSRIPDQSAYSQELDVLTLDYRDGDKMRWQDGPLPYRGFYEPNTVQALFIGQEGTHMAVWMKMPGGSGFGSRVQSFIRPFGLQKTIATMNHSFLTITGQYGFFEYPAVRTDSRGNQSYGSTRFVPNRLHMLMNEGSMQKLRNEQLAWIIENNKKSLKLVMLLGNAGADSGVEFLRSIGADIPTYMTEEEAQEYELPLTKVLSAGGNNEVAVPIDIRGRDIAQVLLRKYSGNKKLELNYSKASDQKRARQVIKDHFEEATSMMIFENPTGGLGNGALELGQFGNDISGMRVKRKGKWVETQSSKGMKIPSSINPGKYFYSPDVLWLKAPHPSSVSRIKDRAEQARVIDKNFFRPIRKAMKAGWTPPTPEPGLDAPFLEDPENYEYVYNKEDLPECQMFPNMARCRIDGNANATRMGADTVIGNNRDKSAISRSVVKRMDREKPSRNLPKTARKLTWRNPDPQYRYVFDRQLADDDVMTKLLFYDEKAAFARLQKPKRGMTWRKHGEDAMYVKQAPEVGTHGNYRGDLNNYEAIVLFDPDGSDTVGMEFAASGNRGQYIQGMMNDMGIGVNHLVLQTAPFRMVGASDEDWAKVNAELTNYIDNIFAELLTNRGLPKVFITDGEQAKEVLERVLAQYDINVPVVNIKRGSSPYAGLKTAARQIKNKVPEFAEVDFNFDREDIPTEHKMYITRYFDGTAGDRVYSPDGETFAYNIPQYASDHKSELTKEERRYLDASLKRLEKGGFILPHETPEEFVRRTRRSRRGNRSFSLPNAADNCQRILATRKGA